jgi:hypothetical protein
MNSRHEQQSGISSRYFADWDLLTARFGVRIINQSIDCSRIADLSPAHANCSVAEQFCRRL